MKKLTFLKSLLLAIGLLAGNIGAFGDNIIPVRTDVSGFSTWTDTDVGGTTYLQLLKATSSTITPVMNFENYSNETLDFKARTYGGVEAIENEIFVAISTDNGDTWTELGSRTPTSTTLTSVVTFDLSSYSGAQVKIKIYVKGTNDSKGAGIDDITISGTPLGPVVTVTEVTLPAFSATAGSSQDQSITVNGTNLTDNITLALSGTDADVFSLSESSITPTAGSVTDKVITITYAPTAPGSHSATLTLSSPGATDVTRSLSGTAGLAAPVAIAASNAGKTSFTANWEPVTGAEEYEISVYTKTLGTTTATELFISEYGEGSGGNKKYVEIFNGTGNNVDLSNYVIKKAVNGGGWYATVYNFPASTVLTNGSTFVLANNSTDVIGATAYDTFCNWNGDDAIGLFKNDVLIDIFGTPDSDPGDGWSVAGITNATVDHILIRKPSVTSPTTDWATSAGTTTDDSQWTVSDFVYDATNQTTNLGSHTMDDFGEILHPITGSPFTVEGTETSISITGLSPATTYYYKVIAISGSVRSAASNEIAASTLSDALPAVTLQNIYARDGKIYVNASAAGQRIEVYNTLGQRLVNVVSKEGENEISVPAKGILLVKAGSQVTKVMVP